MRSLFVIISVMLTIWLLSALGALCVVAVAGVLFIYRVQRRWQYFPTSKDKAAKGSGSFEAFRGQTGELLGYIRRVSEPEFVMIVFHGNSGEAIDRKWYGDPTGHKAVCILAEYPGYGALEGKPSEDAILEHAESVYDRVESLWPGIPVRVVGESLGTGPATYLSSRRKIDRLALIAPFSSAADVAALRYRYLPTRLLMRDRFDAVEFVRNSTAPLHIAHGTLDEVVPLSLAKKLFAAYPGPKYMTEILGFGHSRLDEPILHSPFCKDFRDFAFGDNVLESDVHSVGN